jgi:hypothetical protein
MGAKKALRREQRHLRVVGNETQTAICPRGHRPSRRQKAAEDSPGNSVQALAERSSAHPTSTAPLRDDYESAV